jgi:hypothetical protein
VEEKLETPAVGTDTMMVEVSGVGVEEVAMVASTEGVTVRVLVRVLVEWMVLVKVVVDSVLVLVEV